MRTLTVHELRTMYISFFVERGHAAIPSASLVPADDPSVLFTTAGMHPLVPYLLGREHPAGDMLVDYQKCVRTNDIDSVGDATHLTFFEMLGNWSLGAYFKEESIRWSFEFLTDPAFLGIDLDRLWVTVFAGNDDAPRDDEAARIWLDLGMDPARLVYLGAEHNWWSAGPEGPCGPDTEIFFDTTGRPCPGEDAETECLPGVCGGERFFEVWNNVFMTFDRRDGKLLPLPKRNVDTGMGIERTVAVLNGARSVYDTDLLLTIREAIARRGALDAGSLGSDEKMVRALRILTDHLRTATFILGDQNVVLPSNQGAGYVLRRLIRRGARFCGQLGIDPQDWAELSELIVSLYAEFYPELRKNIARIRSEFSAELDRFGKTLARGTARLEKELMQLPASNSPVLPGQVAFHLYDTYGFPVELTAEMAREKGADVDLEDYRRCLAEHREKSRGSAQSAAGGLVDTSDQSVRYHTATHLLHSALRSVLGDHVYQSGSNITAERLRFDFSHPNQLSADEVRETEQLVQEWIDAGYPVTHEILPQEQARRQGAIGLFDDRYSGDVSVYRIADKSLEFCGGPHVTNTNELGRFKIVKEQSAGAGIRRIRAILADGHPPA